MTETPDEILRALANPERLAIAGSLAGADATATSLADLLQLPVARVRRHLNRLTATGVARLGGDRKTYRLDPETLRWAAEQVGPPRGTGLPLGAASDEEAVLRAFLRDGRLTEIPARESKRRIVLERIALEFEPGVHYDEKTVNAIVGKFFNDYAALRRYSSTGASSTAIAVNTGGAAAGSRPEPSGGPERLRVPAETRR